MKGRYLVDANIPMYAAGAASQWKAPCVAFLSRAGAGDFEAFTDVEVLQEILHRYLHLSKRPEAFQVYDLFSQIVGEVLAVEAGDMDAARVLLESHPALTSRDAIHAAIARRHGLAVVSYDRHFDVLPFISRLEPDQEGIAGAP